jgi:DNA-binding MarR family transcriptional regulator
MQEAVQRTGTGARTPAVLAWLRLMRVYQRISAASAQGLRSLGLSVGQFDVLAHLGSRRRTTQQDLARSLLVTKGNVSQVVERMEAAGWVARCQEGRTKFLDLTPAGRRLFRKAVPWQEALIGRTFAGLTIAEQNALARILKRLEKNI